MLIRRCDVHVPSYHQLIVARLGYRKHGPPAEDARDQAVVVRVHVLHDQQRKRKVVRQFLEQGAERRQPTR